MRKADVNDPLNKRLQVINIGLEDFSRDLADQDIQVTQIEWVPPAGGDPKLAKILSKLGS